MDVVRTSLEVGFPEDEIPEDLVRFRGRQTRSIGPIVDFPFEDAQFDVVLMHACAVNEKAVREAHRVLVPSGRLLFEVPEMVKGQDGFSLPDIYSILRSGYNIIGVTRRSWWRFWRRRRVLSICAQKKNWRPAVHSYRPYV